jgi:hypothetical protein
MGSIMDQPRPWERDPVGWDKPPKKPEPKPACAHDWKMDPKVHPGGFVYDYEHQLCTKCAATRMV